MRARPKAHAAHGLKTHHMSSMNARMYVTRGFVAAVVERALLTALDPTGWISHREVAELSGHFNAVDAAAEIFEMAAQCGPPYLGQHLFSAAWRQESAVAHHTSLALNSNLLAGAPNNSSVIASRASFAARVEDDRFPVFRQRRSRVRRSSVGTAQETRRAE